jgi:methylmalonyl-CoA/ethylmalonyl-CoA epimerase
METYHKTLGWEPGVCTSTNPIISITLLSMEKKSAIPRSARKYIDPIDFEILQPLEGPSIYKEFLEKRGEGLQHVSVVSPKEDVHAALNHFKVRESKCP